MEGILVVHEYEKIARRVGLIVLVLALVIQILANEIPSFLNTSKYSNVGG